MNRLFLAAILTLALTTPVLAAHAQPTCSLSQRTLGGVDVIQIDASGLRHNADYRIDWVEPQITQVQYRWSSVTGTLYQTVLDNQGPGTFTASLFFLSYGPRGQEPSATFEASCSLAV